MKNAFKKWSDITNLDFKEVKNPDIRVRFEEGQHDDIFAFDGPKGVLAHAFYPPIEPDDGKCSFNLVLSIVGQFVKGFFNHINHLLNFGSMLENEHLTMVQNPCRMKTEF